MPFRRRDPEETCYAGRPAGIVPVMLSMEKEAWDFVRAHALGRRSMGRYLSRLVFEERARLEERSKWTAVPEAQPKS
jgi:hypothetical protein